MLLIISWYVIGYLSTVVGIYYNDSELKVFDVMIAFLIALIGPISSIMMISLVFEKSWDKVLISKRRKK